MNDMTFLTVNRRFALAAVAASCALAALPARAAEELPADASATVRKLVRWATATADHQGLPFAVIDKPAAQIHIFSARGEWMSSSPVLLGAALGDRSAPDIGQRPLSQIRQDERTTPAGRFITEPGRNLKGDDIVWIDYEAAVSLHRVRSVSAAERRQQRLASQGASDKRISYGCVNAPEAFYNRFIAPLFGQSRGVIYVLPDTEPFATFFVAASAYP
jgi:hypothetical protein